MYIENIYNSVVNNKYNRLQESVKDLQELNTDRNELSRFRSFVLSPESPYPIQFKRLVQGAYDPYDPMIRGAYKKWMKKGTVKQESDPKSEKVSIAGNSLISFAKQIQTARMPKSQKTGMLKNLSAKLEKSIGLTLSLKDGKLEIVPRNRPLRPYFSKGTYKY